MASFVFFILIATGIDYFVFQKALIRELWKGDVEFVYVIVVVVFVCNVLGDYLSLLATRLLLRFTRRHPQVLWLTALMDLFGTGLLFFSAVFTSGLIAESIEGKLSLENLGRTFQLIAKVIEAIFLKAEQFDVGGSAKTTILLYASLATAYLTCIWLWLALIFTPVVRVLVWSRTTGLTAIGRILDAQNKPMVALGYATALVILACGGIVWGVGHALAAMGR